MQKDMKKAMAAVRFSNGTLSPIWAIVAGMMPAAKMPFMTRNASKVLKLSVKLQATVPREKKTKAMLMVRSLPMRSAMGPYISWKSP